MVIYVFRGLPASGKSTKARFLVNASIGADKKQICRLNKDDLREMLHNGVYSTDNEALVRDIWKDTIRLCIKHDRNLVIDDCNLNPLHIQAIKNIARIWSKEFKVPVKIRYLDIRTSIETCIKRDSQRARSVGEKVIRGMAEQYGWETDKLVSFWGRLKSFFEGPK